MALTVHRLRALDIPLLFSKKPNKMANNRETNEKKSDSIDKKNHFKKLIAHDSRLSSVFAIAIFFI